MDLISVIIPAYNVARFIEEAIRSVLAQSYRPLQIIVIDDGSTDGTSQAAAGFGELVEVHRVAHRGASSSRNEGIARARGSRIAFLDADDLWTIDKLTLQAAALDSDPELEAVFGHAIQFHDNTRDENGAHSPLMAAYAPGAMLIRAEALARIGPFDPELPRGDVVEWYVRARERGLRHRLLPEVVLHRRIHGANLGTYNRDEQRAEYLRIVKGALDRRRRGAAGDRP